MKHFNDFIQLRNHQENADINLSGCNCYDDYWKLLGVGLSLGLRGVGKGYIMDNYILIVGMFKNRLDNFVFLIALFFLHK